MEILSPQELWWQVFNLPKSTRWNLVATRAVAASFNLPLVEASFQLAEFQQDGNLVATRKVVPIPDKMESC